MSHPNAADAGSVISLSEIFVNINMGVNAIPHPGGYAYAGRHNIEVGGGFPLLKAASRMGVRAEHAGIVGNGTWGSIIRDAMAFEGITHTGLDRLDEDSGFRVLLSDGGSRKTLIATFGAEAHGNADAFDMIHPKSHDVVHISGNTLTNRTASAVYAFLRREDEHWSDYSLGRSSEGFDAAEDVDGGLAATGGSGSRRYQMVFNPTGALMQHVNEALLETLVLDRPIWSCNKQEARIIAHRLGAAITEPEPITVNGNTDAAMPELCRLLGEILKAPLIIRTGATGAWVWEPNADGGTDAEPVHVPGHVVKAVHMQSAGSCHTGALCAMLARGASLVEAVRIANAASALAVERAGENLGGDPECPNYDEAQELANRELR
ncbi:sugar kinase [Bifidobacterium sp. SMB2]|uniref:Sugar kinase n=1 Tax=Bifidobacterium saimiriisciurei TaxID=2661627 RepID=A0ABX0CB39_9BIFI|nr:MULTISPECIES: PfkB family carbohydrate kinase [Bifidobacterium]NEG95382.1 sugar kinase [Bifidobacterium sp. SMB2]NEH11434.1 sugar kinase [Bifidobacterium saimiriisciurei]